MRLCGLLIGTSTHASAIWLVMVGLNRTARLNLLELAAQQHKAEPKIQHGQHMEDTGVGNGTRSSRWTKAAEQRRKFAYALNRASGEYHVIPKFQREAP